MKNEFALAFNEVLTDKQLPREVVMDALEAAMVSAYRKAVNASNAQQVIAKVDADSGKVLVFAEKEVVEQVQDNRTEVALEQALVIDPEAELGGMVVVETTPKNFGRVAAQTARQVIQQRIREAERDAQYRYYNNLSGEIVNGIVQALSSSHITLGLDKKAEGIMPRNQQIGGERFRVHDRVRALLLEAKQSPRGPQIILTRAHRRFLRRLLEDEVPEIYHGLVEIRSIAREPGHRSKVAVAALQAGIDPVGACVGVRGVRIQAIVRELNDEKIDVIEWSADPGEYIAKALSPARVTGVYLDKHAKGAKTATVVVPEDQLSLAIGRDGQNARLAAKLTTWRIDIKSLSEAAADALHRLQVDPEYMLFADTEARNVPRIEEILGKKAEGRPILPEEYHLLSGFVNRIELQFIDGREASKVAEKERQRAIRDSIPKLAMDTPLEELGISLRLSIVLGGEGYSTIGDLMYQLELDSDGVLALNGVGPKAMADIEAKLEEYKETLALAEAEAKAAEEAAKAAAAAEEAAKAAEEVDKAPVAEAEAVAETEIPGDVKIEAGPEVEAVTAQVTEAEPVVAEPEVEEPQVAEPAQASQPQVEAEEAPLSPEDALFDASALTLEPVSTDDEDDPDETEAGKEKKKKKKKRYSEVEYDPDLDMTVVRRKRKRSSNQDWDEDWDY